MNIPIDIPGLDSILPQISEATVVVVPGEPAVGVAVDVGLAPGSLGIKAAVYVPPSGGILMPWLWAPPFDQASKM